MAKATNNPKPQQLRAVDLADSQVEGLALFKSIQKRKTRIVPLEDGTQTIYWSAREADKAYTVSWKITNVRGTVKMVYMCSCPDAKKYMRRDCEHQFAEKLRRGEVVITGRVPVNRPRKDKAGRRPARKRLAEDGRSIKSAQRDARVKMPGEIPRLVLSLKNAYDARHPEPVPVFRTVC